MTRCLPLPAYRTVLDLCCGQGRHAVPLAARGYHVTGLDRDSYALAEGRRKATGNVQFVQGDTRDLSSVPGSFDAIINLWQSFGYFDAVTNSDILRQISNKLNRHGRLLLDIYHRGFFEAHQGERSFLKDGINISESKRMIGDRLTVMLDYGPTAPPDVFEWQLYTPEQIVALARGVGLQPLAICTGFDEAMSPIPTSPRMQLVFQKDSAWILS